MISVPPQARPFGLGLFLGLVYFGLRALRCANRVRLHSRNAKCEIHDTFLRLTNWRGRSCELNWDEVSLNQATSKVRIVADGEVLMEVGAREFEDGYTLINELAQRVRKAQAEREAAARIDIIPFPPGFFERKGAQP